MNSLFPDNVLKRLESCGVVAVLVVDEVAHAVPLARALLAGGVEVMELTLRTPAALEALAAIRGEVPEMLAGIGTILNPVQARAAAAAGAAFGVAPGMNPRVIAAAQEAGLPFAPGIATPSELEAALELGCRELKFFPAESLGGVSYLKNIYAPYAHLGVRFMPLGGLKAASIDAYLKEPFTLALGGSWIATRDMIRAAAWDQITSNAADARQAVDRIRGGAA
jgi:2-dehydro-3-deoxyphosphogluconate aldolase/(4S)-4-hydroxy-2-oxoglutarate aldolase